MNYKRTLRAIGEWLIDSEVLTCIAVDHLSRVWPPKPKGMSYDTKPRFFWLPNQEFYDLPRHTQPFQARAKIELHKAKRAGTHLDFRIILPSTFFANERVYDFAVVQRTTFPSRGERPTLVIQRNNHSIDYFNTDSHTFGPGEYGEGEMRTVWRGIIDVTNSDPTKIEFQINDGDFAGRYCLFTSKSEITPDTRNNGWLIRMKEPQLIHKERMQFISGDRQIDAARANPQNYIAEIKADGANYMLVPGPKENTVVSRRLSVNGQPINQSSKMPWLKYLKFPKEYHGRTLHVEIVEYDPSETLLNHGHHTHTAGLLNSNTERSRSIQVSSGKPLVAMVWDIDGDQPYGARRAEYLALTRAIKVNTDMRRWGSQRDRFISARLLRPRVLTAVPDNTMMGMSVDELKDFVDYFGGEGVVLKPLDGQYYGEPYIKWKASDTFDVRIVGYQEGEGKYRGSLGAIIVEDPQTGVQSRVGSGFTDQQRAEIWASQQLLTGTMVEVEAHELSPRGALRGPRFVGFHPDNGEELIEKMDASTAEASI